MKKPPVPGPKSLSLLIVEDQESMRASLRAFVASAFPSVHVLDSSTGAQALKTCINARPQLVLMDIRLPDANGIELTRQMRALSPAPAVIVVSFLKGQQYVDRARAAGACQYIWKGSLDTELLPAITWALGVPCGE